jgi:hypothetical protein
MTANVTHYGISPAATAAGLIPIGNYHDESGESWLVFRNSQGQIVLADSPNPDDISSQEWVYGPDNAETRDMLSEECADCDSSVIWNVPPAIA